MLVKEETTKPVTMIILLKVTEWREKVYFSL